MKNNFEKRIDNVFFRCPACLLSFKRLICDFTCSPDQDKFVKSGGLKTQRGFEQYIANFTVDMTKEFRDGLWETCKDNPASGRPLRDAYPNGVDDFLGSMFSLEPSDPQVIPLFLPSNATNGYKGQNVPCEQMCRCSTCSRSCENIEPVRPDYSCRIYTLKCDVFAYIVTGIVMLFFIVSSLIIIAQRVFLFGKKFLPSSREEDYMNQDDQTIVQ